MSIRKITALTGMALASLTGLMEWGSFLTASTGIELIKALVVAIVSNTAFLGFLGAFRRDEWPL